MFRRLSVAALLLATFGMQAASAATTRTHHRPAGSTPTLPGVTIPVLPVTGGSSSPAFWLASASGGVWNFGDAASYGAPGATPLASPIVGITATSDKHGYWLVASDGGVFPYGDAKFFGSTGALHLTSPIVAIAA